VYLPQIAWTKSSWTARWTWIVQPIEHADDGSLDVEGTADGNVEGSLDFDGT
jgi:hypothetical protein